jgi:hypothetical protein
MGNFFNNGPKIWKLIVFVCPQGNDLEPTDSTFLSSTKLTMSTH